MLYRNEDERKEFERFLEDNIDRLDELEESDFGRLTKHSIERSDEQFVFDPVDMFTVKDLFSWWESQKDSA